MGTQVLLTATLFSIEATKHCLFSFANAADMSALVSDLPGYPYLWGLPGGVSVTTALRVRVTVRVSYP